MSKKAVFSGSFDPITNGHLNIIERVSKIFDELTVLIVENSNKQSCFSLEQRIDILKKVLEKFSNVKVDSHSGLFADYINANNFDVVIRGIRNSTDFDYENQMAECNKKLYNKDIETLFLITEPQFSHISSSAVKEIAALGGEVGDMVPDYVNKLMEVK